MKKVRIAINGFGRIGRIATRIASSRTNIEIVAINSRADIKSHAYLLQHDTTYGKFSKKVDIKDDKLIIGNNIVSVFYESDPLNIPWSKVNADVIIEATGIFRDYDSTKIHLRNGAKLVVISAPPKDDIPIFCMGVNHKIYNPKIDKIISNASCTTNCLATVCKVLEDNIGIIKGFMTTIHSYTDSQNLLDNSHKKDLRLARSAVQNIIPSSTGASKALASILPNLKDKIMSSSIRVPTPTVSLIDLIVEVGKKTSSEEINNFFIRASEKYLKNILGFSIDSLVSSDIKGSSYSAVIDGLLTRTNDNLVNVKAWYDNEWGYTSRLIDLIEYVAKVNNWL